MTRYGAQFGPDITFLGVDRCDLDEPETYADADVVILGAPFDGGTSHRPGTRFGPQAIRMTDYLPHDGSRPSLALRVDGLQDLRGRRDVLGCDRGGAPGARGGGHQGCRGRSDSGDPRRRSLHRLPRRQGVRQCARSWARLDDPLRCARRHWRHRVRIPLGAWAADASAHRIGCPARRSLPPDRAARLLAAAGDAGLDGAAADAFVRDDRDRPSWPRRMSHRGLRDRDG